MDVMGEAIEIMGAMDGRGACHQQSPCDQPPPALLTQQEHLILRLVEVERCGLLRTFCFYLFIVLRSTFAGGLCLFGVISVTML